MKLEGKSKEEIKREVNEMLRERDRYRDYLGCFYTAVEVETMGELHSYQKSLGNKLKELEVFEKELYDEFYKEEIEIFPKIIETYSKLIRELLDEINGAGGENKKELISQIAALEASFTRAKEGMKKIDKYNELLSEFCAFGNNVKNYEEARKSYEEDIFETQLSSLPYVLRTNMDEYHFQKAFNRLASDRLDNILTKLEGDDLTIGEIARNRLVDIVKQEDQDSDSAIYTKEGIAIIENQLRHLHGIKKEDYDEKENE